jgi:hypothetical protein
MSGLKQSCLRWTIFYLIVAAVVSALVYLRFPVVKVAAIGGLVGGFFLWMGIAYIIGMGDRRAEVKSIRRGMQGGRPEDGEKVAVVGMAGSSMDAFESPMTKKRCVLYEYKILPPGNEQAGIYEGFALAPMTIEGPRGSIRLMAAPELTFPHQNITRMEQRENARAYIERTQFMVRKGVEIGKEIDHLKSVLADDDGRIRYDIHRPDLSQRDLSLLALQEKTIAPGEPIVAIGRYSAARNALVPDPAALLHPVKILKGNGAEVIRQLRGRDRIDGCMSCGCLTLVSVAALVGLLVFPLDAIEQMFPKKDPTWAEVKLERALDRKVRPKLAGTPLAREGETTIVMELGQARGKVTVGDVTHPLATSSARRDGNVIEVMLDGRVQLRIREDESVESLTLVGEHSVPPEEVELRTLSIDANEVSGRVTYLPQRDGPLLRATFRAPIR